MGKRPRLQQPFQPNGPRGLVDSATYAENANVNSENTQNGVYITYTSPVLREVREDSMQIFTQFQLSRDQEYLPGNKLEGFKPLTEYADPN